jgi:hypothetical protein
VLEVLATDGGHSFSRIAQHVEEPEQAHRRLYTHINLIEVDKDRHQRDGVWRQVMELKVIGLQQCEEGGGEWEYEPR